MDMTVSLWKKVLPWLAKEDLPITTERGAQQRIAGVLRTLTAIGERPTKTEFDLEADKVFPYPLDATRRYAKQCWKKLAENPYYPFRNQRLQGPFFTLVESYSSAALVNKRLLEMAHNELDSYYQELQKSRATEQSKRMKMSLMYLEYRFLNQDASGRTVYFPQIRLR